MKIILLGRPLSTNHLYGQRGKYRYLKAPGRKRKDDYVKQARQQYTGIPMEGPLEIIIKLYRYGAELDWDNCHKLSMDALNQIVYFDDSQIQKATVEKVEKDNANPRIEIEFISHNGIAC